MSIWNGHKFPSDICPFQTDICPFQIDICPFRMDTNSKLTYNSITFNIIQFAPVDVEDPCYVTSMTPKDVVYFYGTVTKVGSLAQVINVTCSHFRIISLDLLSVSHNFTYVTAIGTIANPIN